MKTVCCVCKVKIRDDKKKDGLISHGYCEKCSEVENRKMDIAEMRATMPPLLLETFEAIRPGR